MESWEVKKMKDFFKTNIIFLSWVWKCTGKMWRVCCTKVQEIKKVLSSKYGTEINHEKTVMDCAFDDYIIYNPNTISSIYDVNVNTRKGFISQNQYHICT